MSHDATSRRIALVTDAWFPQVNGVVRTLSNVVDELTELGHEVLVISPQHFRTMPCPMYPEIRLSLFPWRKTHRMLEEFDFDAIHVATEGPLGLIGRRFARKRRLPFTTSYHTQYAQYLKKYLGLPESVGYMGLRWFHNAAQRTLVPTQRVVDELDAQGFTGLRVWTRGVNTDLFKPLDDWGDEFPRPVMLYAGRVSREKNLSAFLELDLPGSKVIVGGGPELKSFQQRYPEAHFVGFKHGEELARCYASADVFVFPSLTDTFGVVMLEAMACGVPTAAYPVTGPIDVIRQGETGILHDDLATAVNQALELDRATCRRVAMDYSWRRVAELFRDTLVPIKP